MIALSLNEVKDCMSKLLLKDTFDHFSFIEGDLVTSTTFRMDGFIQKGFFSSEDIPCEKYISWKEMREHYYHLIRGKRTPLSFQIILGLSQAQTEALLTKHQLGILPQNVSGLFLNIRFENGKLTCTTGTSLNVFTLDKSLEKLWDDWSIHFFSKQEIAFDLLL